MKRAFLFILFTWSCLITFAQQRPHYTQYLQNMDIINPAITGMYKSVTIKSGFRNQWIGIQDAPKTSYFTVHAPVNLDKSLLTAGSADYGILEPGTRSEKDEYYSSEGHHGLGLTALNDKTGPINRSTLNLTYAYHIMLDDVFNLSLGIGGGVSRIGLNTDLLIFENQIDPVISEGQIINWTPDINTGFYLYSSKFYFGGSIQQVVKEKLSFNSGYGKGMEVPHYFLTSGFRFWVGEDFSFTPSIMMRVVSPTPVGIDLNLKINYRNNFWIGGAYRSKDSFSGLVGFTISKTLDAGYAYDQTISSLRTINTGSHEFVLGIKL
jgi:type IX secretion system PorP/SprF family membrane protein